MRKFTRNDWIISAVFALIILVIALFSVFDGDKKSSNGISQDADHKDYSGKSLENMKALDFNSPEYTIGVATGTGSMMDVETWLPKARIAHYSDNLTAYEAVRLGKIDAYAYDRLQMEIAIKSGLSGVALINDTIGDGTEISVGISRTSSIPDLEKKLNEFIALAKEDGRLDDLFKRWVIDCNYDMPEIPQVESPSYTLMVGTTGVVEPYSFYKNNELTGYDIELAKRFAAFINAKIEFRVYNYSSIIAAADTNEIDCIFANLNVTEERKEKIDFSDPIIIVDTTLMVAAENETASNQGGNGGAGAEASWFSSVKESFYKNFIREERYKLIFQGIGTTCLITIFSAVFGSILAFLICVFRQTEGILPKKICVIYVKLFQGTPIVVLLMILYYIVFGKSGLSAMWIAVIGFSLNFAAYVSEILQSGIESIDKGQREAALALGYSESQAFFRFIFPPAALRQIPVYRGEIISLLKNTAIVGYIAIQDLTKMSDIIRSRTYEAFFPLIATAVIYFLLAWIFSLIMKLLLRQIDPRAKKRTRKEVAVK
ncbi:MAG: ABC transporter permease subunit [Treponemataceae bacterium]|nr:ABC transporter permease subunit [Treponemataceae bacterium]